jgi:hypothetical protein
MTLLLVLVLLVQSITTTSAHFSSPHSCRVIGVTSHRRTQAPRTNPFGLGRRGTLYASSVVGEPVFTEDEDVVPEDYEEVVEVVPAKQPKQVKSFKELGFFGKIVRGTRDIILVTTTNFGLGVTFGLTAAGVRGFPNLMTRKEGLLGTPWKEEIPMRLKRYTGKCYRWAKIWGPVFAIWGFTDTAISILRNGDNDEFNFMIASSAAAVWHNRDKSIQRKVGVAVLYAVLTYGYVKFNEYYVVGPEGWQDKYSQNEEIGDVASETSRGGEILPSGTYDSY